MHDLFRADWSRYRRWAALLGAGHLLLLAFFMRLADLGQQPLDVYRLGGGVYAVLGILLGLHQMGTWRRPNAWLNLLHRPVAPRCIAGGLLLAGAACLVASVGMPLLVALAWQAWGTHRVVDTRHVLVPAAAFCVACAGYLAGAYAALADRRYAATGLVLLAWLGLAQASGPVLLVVEVVACLWLLAMVLGVFHADRTSPPNGFAAIVVAAMPLQIAVYMLIALLGFLGELAWIMTGSHPSNMATPPTGGFVETERMTGRDRMLAGLRHATLDDVPLWREQVALSEVHVLGRQLRDVPVRHAMANVAPRTFTDDEARIQWTFSETRGRFEGLSTVDGSPAGELGAGAGQSAFPVIPVVDGVLPGLAKGDATIIAGDTLYRYVSATHQIQARLKVNAGEQILGTTPVGGSLVAISDRAVYVFDGRHLVDGAGPVDARLRTTVPGEPGDLARAELVELVDGYLLSFTFTQHAYDMRGAAPYQSVSWLDDAGRTTAVATRVLQSDFPAVYRYRSWWASPVIHSLVDAAIGAGGTPGPYDRHATPPIPASIVGLAALLLSGSLLAGAWLCHRRALSGPRRLAWLVTCAVVGWPAVVSLAFLVPRVEARAIVFLRTSDA